MKNKLKLYFSINIINFCCSNKNSHLRNVKYFLSHYKEPDIAAYNLLRASLLQKLIRRGMQGEALHIADLFINDGHSKGLLRRIKIIAAEDIGFGNLNSISFLEQETDLRKCVAYLCQSPKNRESDRFLLDVVNNRKQILKNSQDPQVHKEVSDFVHLVQLAGEWFTNKNKKTLTSFKDGIKHYADNSKCPEIVMALGENYLDLTRGNIHGARCQLALASLIYSRQSEPTDFIPDFSNLVSVEFDEIFDFAIDMHTPIGKKLGRDFNHWIKNCTLVIPEVNYPELYDNQGKEKYPLTPDSNKF